MSKSLLLLSHSIHRRCTLTCLSPSPSPSPSPSLTVSQSLSVSFSSIASHSNGLGGLGTGRGPSILGLGPTHADIRRLGTGLGTGLETGIIGTGRYFSSAKILKLPSGAGDDEKKIIDLKKEEANPSPSDACESLSEARKLICSIIESPMDAYVYDLHHMASTCNAQRNMLRKTLPFFAVPHKYWAELKAEGCTGMEALEVIDAEGELVFEVTVPPLMEQILVGGPKGFDVNEFETVLVFDKQRLQHIFDFIDSFQESEDPFGVLFSGPNGVGKSAICLATYVMSFVRKLPVVYIPMADIWQEGSDTKVNARAYFMKTFFEQNADLILNDMKLKPFFEDQLRNGKVMDDSYFNFAMAVGERIVPKCGFIVDEVQTLTQAAMKGKDFFATDFTLWTSLSRHFISQQCATAYGRGEFELPSGENKRLRFVRPLDGNVARSLICKEGSPFYIPNTTEAFRSKIVGTFGGMPRPLSELALTVANNREEKSVEEMFIAKRTLEISALQEQCLKRFVEPAENQHLTATILHKIVFGSEFFDLRGKILYDHGLCYVSNGTLPLMSVVSECAEIAITRCWQILEVKFNLDKPLSEYPDNGERGVNFERILLAKIAANPQSIEATSLNLQLKGEQAQGTVLPQISKNVLFRCDCTKMLPETCKDNSKEVSHFLLASELQVDPFHRVLWIPKDRSFFADGIIVPSQKEFDEFSETPILIVEASVTHPYDRKPGKYSDLQKLSAEVKKRFPNRMVNILLCSTHEVKKNEDLQYITIANPVALYADMWTVDKTQMKHLRICF